jgi:hypothetical protein
MKLNAMNTGTLRALCILFFVSAAPQPAMATGPDLFFGYRVAGSYLIENLDIPDAGLEDLQALATISADGGVIATDSDDFGLALTAPHSPKHGVWKRTGKREIAMTVLEFAYNPTGTQHIFTWRLEFTVKFNSRDFNEGSGELAAKLFPVPYQTGSDPLDPDAVPISVASGTFDFRRITP